MNHKLLHKDFKLNNNSFTSVHELLTYTIGFSDEIHHFLEDWFSAEAFIIVQTSGSTGKPKSIKLKKRQMQYSALATGEFFNSKKKTSALLCLPVEYIAGKMMLVRAVTLGWHLDVIESNSFPLKDVFTTYDFSAMVPLQVENSIEKLNLIKKLIVGGGVVSNKLQEKLQRISTEVFATYGMTETITHIAVKKLNFPKAVFENRFSKIQKSPYVQQKNYYKTLPNTIIYQDERNCLVIENKKISNDVIFTNDVVNLISDIQFDWLGRFDNVINSGGIKLHPEKIEEKLTKIIEQRFFVAGLPDEKLSEKLVLIIEESTFSKEEKVSLMLNIKNLKLLSKYEVPKDIYFIDNFVETATKKIQRNKTLDLVKWLQ